MNKPLSFLLLALLLAFCALPVFAQTATVKGIVTDRDGQPMVGAVVEYKNMENGQTYKIKTDKKGAFFSLGIASGSYRVTLFGKANKEVIHFDSVRLTLSADNILNFNLKELAAETAAQQLGVPAKGGKLTPEQQRQLEEQRKQAEAQQKDAAVVKSLNDMLAQARAAGQAGQLDQAITTMQQAVQTDPNRDLLWAVLGQYQIDSGKKAPDAATKTARFADAATSYNKAIELCAANPTTSSCKDPSSLAGYYNNLGQALGNTGKLQESMAAFDKAAQLSPPNASTYYFNEGAVLTNNQRLTEANAAFDKCIAADATKADCYFQKAVNLISNPANVKIGPDGKTIYPAEAGENLQKYLQLAPTGANADSAKAILDEMGKTVQTSYGTKKPVKK